ncbi:hypothetical protein [Leuconostoc gelidum]|uniref:hypothetical protein n=1 Tax=Leuconostoc gelidum TaxID=1244 RepID=UPI001CC3990F|nr:hypothetical protein [Leuconostoc gelidum]MBZ5985974.1 hypothetical protein [Leuconostoc gelidum subsp. gelidum]
MKIFNNFIVQASMFICSYFPLYVLLLVSNYTYIFQLQKNQKINLSYWVIVGILILFILISFGVTYICLNSKPNERNLKVTSVARPADTIISYVATYILPMTTIEFGKNFPNLLMNVLFFCFIGILYTKLGLIYMNPLFVFFNYKPYDARGKIIFSDMPYEKISQESIHWKATSLGGVVYIVRAKYNQGVLDN